MSYVLLCIIVFIIIYICMIGCYLISDENRCNMFNPIYNYKKWKSLNWFGVIVCTLFINIIFLPYSVFIWLFKFIHKLFTMGRK